MGSRKGLWLFQIRLCYRSIKSPQAIARQCAVNKRPAAGILADFAKQREGVFSTPRRDGGASPAHTALKNACSRSKWLFFTVLPVFAVCNCGAWLAFYWGHRPCAERTKALHACDIMAEAALFGLHGHAFSQGAHQLVAQRASGGGYFVNGQNGTAACLAPQRHFAAVARLPVW